MPDPPTSIVTTSAAMQQIVKDCHRLAPTRYPVLIQGETGTGKELIAREIHASSGRRGSFIAVNCGAIPDTLFEVELFGARRGAYSGLSGDRRGLFLSADGGTLFLDEIGEMPAAAQAKLLRTLQDGEVRALGAVKAQVVDTRVVLATHRDLAQMVQAQSFRPDLYYRISGFCLHLPPLRERPADIPRLLELAVDEAAREQRLPPPAISPQVFERALAYPWPGNAREIFHAAAQAVLRTAGQALDVAAFPMLDRRRAAQEEPAGRGELRPFFDALADFERRYLSALLTATQGNLTHAAAQAHLSRSALRAKVQQYGLGGLSPSGPAARSRVRWAAKPGYL